MFLDQIIKTICPSGDRPVPKIGLALGSGGARGLAHVGVIKVLKENNIPIDFIAGASAGAIIGGMYAVTSDIKTIEKEMMAMDVGKILSLLDPNLKKGLIKGDKIKAFIEKYLGKVRFEETQIPFAAVATDYKNGDAVIFRTGDMGVAIRASMSVPLAFNPVEHEGKMLVDGGLSMPVPVAVVKEMGAEVVIAVDLDANYEAKSGGFGLFNMAVNSIDLLRHNLSEIGVQGADIILKPNVSQTYWLDFSARGDLIKEGERAAQSKISEIRKFLKK